MVSVKVRLRLGRLDNGGEVFAVVPLSFVADLLEPSESWPPAARRSGPEAAVLVESPPPAPSKGGLDRKDVEVGEATGDTFSGLVVRGMKSLSKGLAPVMVGGPVRGAVTRGSA
jgi:hypothetical protein